jgi:membrane protein implicated in regulation of membrane protease activity
MTILGLALDPWQLWLALGLVLFISEVFSGDGTLIALGTAALLTALIVGLLLPDLGWPWQAALFGTLGIPTALLVRRLLKRGGGDAGDINTY